jgi:hypothetical protein
MTMQFVINNWYLFVALGVILFLLVMGPLSQHLHGIKNANAAQTVQLLNREDGVVVDVWRIVRWTNSGRSSQIRAHRRTRGHAL